MSSEWMKVMLHEIARKKAEAGEAQAELERRRREEHDAPPAETVGSPAPGRPDDPAQG
jgi:hypothetical protein